MRLLDVRTAMEHDDSGELGEQLRDALGVGNLATEWPKLVRRHGGDPDKAAGAVAKRARLELEPEPEPVPDVQGTAPDDPDELRAVQLREQEGEPQ